MELAHFENDAMQKSLTVVNRRTFFLILEIIVYLYKFKFSSSSSPKKSPMRIIQVDTV